MSETKLHIAALFFLSALPLSGMLFSEENRYSDIRIIESSEYGITFEFRPRYQQVEILQIPVGQASLIRFERAFSYGVEKAGEPDLMMRSIMLAVRGNVGNSITVLGSDYETIRNFDAAPIPALIRTPDGGYIKKFETNTNPSASRDHSLPLAEIMHQSSMQGIPVATIVMHPLQYDRASKELKKYKRILLRVDFGSAMPATVIDRIPEWITSSLLNSEIAPRIFIQQSKLLKPSAGLSVLASGSWYKLEVREEGLYLLDATYLSQLGISIAGTGSIRTVKIFGGSGKQLPEDIKASRLPDLQEIPVYYGNDYILFYGVGPIGWNYQSIGKNFSHYCNPYASSNYYFLQVITSGIQGKQMPVVNLGSSSGSKITETIGRIIFEEDRTNFNQSGQEWFGSLMNSGDSRTVTNRLLGYISGTPVVYSYELLARSDVSSSFTIEESGKTVSTLTFYGMINLDPVQSDYAVRNSERVSIVPSLSDDRSNVKFTYQGNSTTASGWISYLEIFYKQKLTAVQDALVFTSPDSSGSVEFSVDGFSSNDILAVEAGNLFAPRWITTTLGQLMGSITFRDSLVSGSVRKYWVGTRSACRRPTAWVKIPNSNLRGLNATTEFLIITPHEFLSEANRLKIHKEGLPVGDRLETEVVEVDTIFNEFGFGMPDPVALRDCISTIRPKFILLFGDGNYDFKSVLGNDRIFVPTFQTAFSMNQIYSYCYDDFYVSLDSADNTYMNLAIGRLAVRSLAEARLMVDRIIQYEASPTIGSWKNLITVSSDDNNVNGDPDAADNQNQAETLTTRHIPKTFEIKKIYIADYPTAFTASGRRKPEARKDLIDAVNRGTLMLNYTGHGNPKVWAHESILTRDDVRGQFSNASRLAFIVAATCDWGRFDEAGEPSSAEEIMINSKGGAIGVLSATRPVFATDNALLNYEFYDDALPTNAYSVPTRVGSALMLAKNSGVADQVNNRKYHLLGDPTIRLAVPRLVLEVDSINGKAVTSTSLDTLRALAKVTVKASVRASNNAVQDSIQGTALISVFDAERSRTIEDNGTLYTFNQPGPLIYRGENSIRNGRVEATFIIPKDITYENKRGRISTYFSALQNDGRGYSDRVIVGGTDSSAGVDTQGPSIELFLDHRSFRSGDLVSENPLLLVDLMDSSGISAAGSGIGHRLEAWLDGSTTGIDLADYYKGAKDNYQRGSIEYQMNELVPGFHSLRARAWDTHNNSSVAEVQFSVASSTSLSLQNVFSIPNPASSKTSFTFQSNYYNELVPIDVEIKIYTVSGRLVQTLEEQGLAGGFINIQWDCRDRDGDFLGNGTYLYKIKVKTTDGRLTSNALGKLSIVR